MSRVTRHLNQDVEVWRKQRTPDGGGGYETTWVLVAAVRARFSQPTAREQVDAALPHAEWSEPVYFEPDADVLRNDEVRRTGEQTVTVESVVRPSAPNTYLRANCSAREAGA